MLNKLIKIVVEELTEMKKRDGHNPEFVNETQSLIDALIRYLRFL